MGTQRLGMAKLLLQSLAVKCGVKTRYRLIYCYNRKEGKEVGKAGSWDRGDQGWFARRGI
jgi:hypothetical protein